MARREKFSRVRRASCLRHNIIHHSSRDCSGPALYGKVPSLLGYVTLGCSDYGNDHILGVFSGCSLVRLVHSHTGI